MEAKNSELKEAQDALAGREKRFQQKSNDRSRILDSREKKLTEREARVEALEAQATESLNKARGTLDHLSQAGVNV